MVVKLQEQIEELEDKYYQEEKAWDKEKSEFEKDIALKNDMIEHMEEKISDLKKDNEDHKEKMAKTIESLTHMKSESKR